MDSLADVSEVDFGRREVLGILGTGGGEGKGCPVFSHAFFKSRRGGSTPVSGLAIRYLASRLNGTAQARRSLIKERQTGDAGDSRPSVSDGFAVDKTSSLPMCHGVVTVWVAADKDCWLLFCRARRFMRTGMARWGPSQCGMKINRGDSCYV